MVVYSDTTTSDSIFYQPYDFIGYSHVQGLYAYSDCWKEMSLLYFVTTFRHSATGKFNYGNKFKRQIASEMKISLPTTKSGEIDFDYMENYIQLIVNSALKDFDAFINENALSSVVLTSKEKQAIEDFDSGKIRFVEFRIGDLFRIATGRDIIINRTKTGKIPLISHQHENNGISKNIAKLNDRRLFNHADTLALADRGVFLATTQSYDFHIGTRVKAITFLNGIKSENVRLFFVSSINKLQILFKDYLTNATDSLPDLTISLPTTKSNEIDYDFMENYIMAQKKLAMKDVVNNAKE